MSDVIKQLANELSSTLLQLEQVKRERDAYLQLHVETTRQLVETRAKFVQHQRESIDKLKRALYQVDQVRAESAKRDEAYRQLEGEISELKAMVVRLEEQSTERDDDVVQMVERENQELWSAVDECLACLRDKKRSVVEAYVVALKALERVEGKVKR